jgi:hypothetical protein
LLFREALMRRAFGYTVVFALALLSAGCQKIFTYSLAAGLARTSVTVSATISTDDAADLLASTSDSSVISQVSEILVEKAAAGDTAAAIVLINSSNTSQETFSSLLTALNAQADSGDATAATKALAAEAALGASDVVSSVTTPLLDAVAAGTISTATISSIVGTLQNGYEVGGVSDGLDRLTDASTLTAVSADMSSTDLMITALVVAAAALPAGVTDPTDETQWAAASVTKADYQASADVTLAKSIVQEAIDKMTVSGGSSDLLSKLTDLQAQYLGS